MNAVFILDAFFLNEHFWMAGLLWVEYVRRDALVTVHKTNMLSMMKINRNTYQSFDAIKRKSLNVTPFIFKLSCSTGHECTAFFSRSLVL